MGGRLVGLTDVGRHEFGGGSGEASLSDAAPADDLSRDCRDWILQRNSFNL